MQTGAANFAGDPDSELEALQRAPWDWWREQMPICRQWAYLDHAAVAPLSHPAAEAIRRQVGEAETLGDTVWPQWAAAVEAMRGRFADWLSAPASDLFVIPNTSTGISLVAEGWPWQPGENVVLPEGEFPSNLFPWLQQRSRGVDVRIVPRRNGEVHVDDLMHHVDDRTRIIAVSWVGYASGFRVDVADLVRRAHERGALVFLDAIQGLGVHPLNLAEVAVDFLAADGHKWMLGPEGVGIAMVRAEHRPRLRAPIVGWNSVRNSHQFSDTTMELRDDAARFEPGSANMLGIAGLSASVELFLRVRRVAGAQAIENRVLELSDRLTELLREIGACVQRSDQRAHQSGIVTFQVEGMEPAAIRQHALARQVVVSCRGGGVRASVHAYNNEHDLLRLVEAVRSFTSA